MAYFDKEKGKIILSEEDKKMFREVGHNVSTKKTPIANSIIRSILTVNNKEL